MISITEETQHSLEAIALLTESVAFTHLLYEEEKNHTYNLDKINAFFMVRKNGEPIGCGAYSWVGEYYVEIKHIFLDENARGFGCGKKLMQYIEEHAINAGAEIAILETTLKQNAAISLYLSMGYSYIEPYQAVAHAEQVFMSKPFPVIPID